MTILVTETGKTLLLPIMVEVFTGDVITVPWKANFHFYNLLPLNFGIAISKALIYTLVKAYYGWTRQFDETGYYYISCTSSLVYAFLGVFFSVGSRNDPLIQTVFLNTYLPLSILLNILGTKRWPKIKTTLTVFLVMSGIVLSSIPYIANVGKNVNITFARALNWAYYRSLFGLGFILFNTFPTLLLHYSFLDRLGGQSPLIFIYARINNFTYDPLIPWLGLRFSFIEAACAAILYVFFCPYDNYSIFKKDSYLENMDKITPSDVSKSLWLFNWFGMTLMVVLTLIYALCYVINQMAVMILIKRWVSWQIQLAFVQAWVSAVSLVFWILFKAQPFRWDPYWKNSFYFVFSGVTLIILILYYYYISNKEKKSIFDREIYIS